jgi:enoyl-CoA hydratase/carnithine racemase
MLNIRDLDAGIAILQVATDENPYLGAWFAPALVEAVQHLCARKDLQVVILEGGTRYFSAGASREALTSGEDATRILAYVPELPRQLLTIPVPTIAAMTGHAIGGGLMLGLWCDLTLWAGESLYGANFMDLGFTPGMGSTVVLEEVMVAALARELLYTGRCMKGHELKAAGVPFTHAILPRAQVSPRALALAQEIAEKPQAALRLLRQTLSARRRARLEQAILAETAMHQDVFAREETVQEITERYA